MGTGIGKYCEICNEQLNYDDGFNAEETACTRCMGNLERIKQFNMIRLSEV